MDKSPGQRLSSPATTGIALPLRHSGLICSIRSSSPPLATLVAEIHVKEALSLTWERKPLTKNGQVQKTNGPDSVRRDNEPGLHPTDDPDREPAAG
jgi:hypothetical protein